MTAASREERARMRGAQNGSVADLETLFREHWPDTYRAAYLIVQDRLSAQEVAQEAFLAAVRVLQRFGRDRLFGSWLYRTVVTRSIDGARGRVSRRGAVREALLHVPDPLGWSQPVIDPLADDEALGIAHGLSFLSPEQRAGVVLRYLFQYAPGEIAGILDVSRSTVNARLRRDRDHLEARLAAAGPVSAHDLRAYLRSIPLPDERAAEERAWEVVRTAFATRDPVERVRGFPWRGLVLFGLVVAGVAVAFSPAGEVLWDRLRDELGRETVVTTGTPPVEAGPLLPAPGRLLALEDERLLVLEEGAPPVELGVYAGASWSPDGTFVTAWNEEGLVALDPAGRGGVQWSIEGEGVADATWSSTGFRVAYRSGSALRVVSANGTRDRELAKAAAPIPPAWKPGRREVLAYADPKGRVTAADADRRELLWRAGVASTPVALAWTADGERLAVLGERELRLFEGPAAKARIPLPEGSTGAALSARPGTGDLAYSVFSVAAGKGSVFLYDGAKGVAHLLFAGSGRFGELVWSPDGRYLLVGWQAADEWLFVEASGAGGVVARPGIREELAAGSSPASFPRALGWCCAEHG